MKLRLTIIILIIVITVGSIIITTGFISNSKYVEIPNISNQYDNLLNGDWVHICWSIDGSGVWTVHINNVKEDNMSKLADVLSTMVLDEDGNKIIKE